MRNLILMALCLTGCATYSYDLGEDVQHKLDEEGIKGACWYKCSNVPLYNDCRAKVKYGRYCECTCPIR